MWAKWELDEGWNTWATVTAVGQCGQVMSLPEFQLWIFKFIVIIIILKMYILLFSMTLLSSFLDIQCDNNHVHCCMRMQWVVCDKWLSVFSLWHEWHWPVVGTSCLSTPLSQKGRGNGREQHMWPAGHDGVNLPWKCRRASGTEPTDFPDDSVHSWGQRGTTGMRAVSFKGVRSYSGKRGGQPRREWQRTSRKLEGRV